MNYSGTDFYCDVAIPGKTPLVKEYESDTVLAYHHTRPSWPVHILVVPKKHVADIGVLPQESKEIVDELLKVLVDLSAKVKEEYGASRILTNLGTYQDSKHLHFHITSGDPLKAGS